MIRRTLMQRNQELVDFEFDPETNDVRIIDASPEGEDVLASVRPARLAPEPIRPSRSESLSWLARKRAISPLREDKDDIIAAFGVKSPIRLALMGHGLSLSDQFWYRAPGGTERWEDINFFDNEWDPSFGAAVFKRDYAGLASCSPNTPDATTCGHAVKTWERNAEGIFLIKESMTRESLVSEGADLRGAKLASDLCARLFDEGCCVRLDIVERYGKPCSASPLMLAADEEFVDGNRLRAIAGMFEEPKKGEHDRMSKELFQSLIEAYAAAGIADASAHIAKMACCFCLTFVVDFHPGNFGAIRKLGTGTWRPAPIFDFEGPFGISGDDDSVRVFLRNPELAKFLCACNFSLLDSSWDWSWYDPQALEGFEDCIMEALSPSMGMQLEYAGIVANLFAMQRAYVNDIASAQV